MERHQPLKLSAASTLSPTRPVLAYKDWKITGGHGEHALHARDFLLTAAGAAGISGKDCE